MVTQFRPGRAQASFAFILLFLLYFFDYADRMVVSSLFPFLQKDWGLSDAESGMLSSAVYWAIVLTTIPISIAVDRWSRKKSIAIMAIIWSIATGLCGFAMNFSQLIAARIGIGLGEAGYAPGGTAMMSGLFSARKRSVMMGLWNAAIPLGAATGIALGGFIAQRYGWRHAFGLVALPGLIVSFLFFFVKDYKTVKISSDSIHSGAFWKSGLLLLRTPTLALTYLGFAANTFVTTSLIIWLPTYFHRIENLPMDKAGPKGGAVMLLAIIGAPLGGFLADRWLKSNPAARPLFAGFSSILTGIIFAIAFLFLKGNIQYIFILLGGLCAVSYVPAAAAITQDVVHPGVRAISYSLCVVVQNLLGSSTGPIFIGAVSDAWGILASLSLLPIFSILSGILFLFAARHYVKDLAAVEKVDLLSEA